MTDKAKKTFTDYWQVILAIALVIFNVGFSLAQLQNKPDREEMNQRIEYAIEKYKSDTKDQYVKIDQVPGLNERLKSIDDNLQDIKERLDRQDRKR